ncbi:hypothetical protein PLEOSDRAFT_52272 [Pleurotus ostreatus PC15]|uniref:Uncharacterized protein n=1 Tax=Pleurotus ostreatus (strain PC15) TaxID=1137138 RepID=A0A067NL67_PLEO1|nr:hypothetical protein PLEOSDRAFT_52272 [Pleurotus ostreatus PC15]
MAPGRPVGTVKVRVPRHNAQRLGAKLGAQVKAVAKAEAIVADTYQPTHDSVALAQAVESASEWNSMLITARAQRGPQWDIGTQQFLVDDGSDLYYDPTPILEAVKKLTEDEAPKPHESHKPVGRGTPQPMRGDPGGREFAPQHPHGMPHDGGVVGTPQHQRHPGVQAYPPYGVGVGMSPAGPSPMRQQPQQQQYASGPPPGGVGPFNPVQAGQFYNQHQQHDVPSPMRGMGMGMGAGMGAVGMDQVGVHPGVPGVNPMQQHPGMHGGMGGGMGMVGMPPGGGMPMHISPDIRQRMARGMGAEFGVN